MEPSEKSDPLKPDMTTLCKLGSLAMHVMEGLSAKGHPFDLIAMEQLIHDPDVTKWLAAMDKLALIPKAR